jgi:hypothetical protein
VTGGYPIIADNIDVRTTHIPEELTEAIDLLVATLRAEVRDIGQGKGFLDDLQIESRGRESFLRQRSSSQSEYRWPSPIFIVLTMAVLTLICLAIVHHSSCSGRSITPVS